MEKNIYNETIEDLYKRFDSSRNGLKEVEAKKRLLANGENKLDEQKKKSNIVLFIEQFNDFMIILLITASIFSAIISFKSSLIYCDSNIVVFITDSSSSTFIFVEVFEFISLLSFSNEEFNFSL